MMKDLQQQAARGATLVLARTIALRFLTFGSSVILARVLAPSEYGIYAIITFVITFFSTFSDVGLGAALVQQEAHPSKADLSTTFTVQCCLTLALGSIGFFAASLIGKFYALDNESVWLIRVMLLSLPISFLRTIPALLLERQMAYGKLSLIEVVEVISFYGSAVVFALAGNGVWSFVLATLIRGVLGLIIAFRISPWIPQFGISWSVLKRLMRFGIPYQLQGIVSFINDSMTPTVLALLVGTTAVGYVNWAFGLASIPLIITNTLSRIAFPAFARAQGDLPLLKSMVERGMRLSAIIYFPISFLLMGAAPQIIHFVFTDKWLPGLISFYLFSIALWGGQLLSASFFSVFYATNRAKLALYFIILSGVLHWVIGVPLVLSVGFNGIAIRSLIATTLTLIPLLWVVRRIIPINTFSQLIRPFSVAFGAAVVEFIVINSLPEGIVALLAGLVCGGGVYILAISILERSILRMTLRSLLPPVIQQHYVFRRYLT